MRTQLVTEIRQSKSRSRRCRESMSDSRRNLTAPITRDETGYAWAGVTVQS